MISVLPTQRSIGKAQKEANVLIITYDEMTTKRLMD